MKFLAIILMGSLTGLFFGIGMNLAGIFLAGLFVGILGAAALRDERDPIVTAQHEETGRCWRGRRSNIPRRYHEVREEEE